MSRATTSEGLSTGATLGRYRIDRRLGGGGMGTVYAAWDTSKERAVALKLIDAEHTEDPAVVARFRREATIMSETRHPNIVEVLDHGEADGRWYLAMDLLEGRNLSEALAEKGTYEPAAAVPVLAAILRALEAAHARQVVHRDLKPENVFLTPGPGGDVVRVLDFGVAKVVGASAQEQLTRSGTVVGTPEFMSPEQATGTEVDARSDLYAVGCIAFALLCGRPPFVDNWPMRVVMKQAFEPAPPPSRVRPALAATPAVDAFVGRALAKKPAERFQSAAEMRVALASVG